MTLPLGLAIPCGVVQSRPPNARDLNGGETHGRKLLWCRDPSSWTALSLLVYSDLAYNLSWQQTSAVDGRGVFRVSVLIWLWDPEHIAVLFFRISIMRVDRIPNVQDKRNYFPRWQDGICQNGGLWGSKGMLVALVHVVWRTFQFRGRRFIGQFPPSSPVFIAMVSFHQRTNHGKCHRSNFHRSLDSLKGAANCSQDGSTPHRNLPRNT